MEPIKNIEPTKPTYDLQKIWDGLAELGEDVTEDLGKAKGLVGYDFCDRALWRWHTNQIKGWSEGIFMPYYHQGKMVTARLRRNGDPRFLSLPGGESYPYWLDQIKHPTVYVTEGETDCLTLNFLDIPAIGIPGATNTNAIRKLFIEAAKHHTALVAIPDNDEAGETFLARLRVAAFDYHVKLDVFRVPYGKDVNEWHAKSAAGEVQDLIMSHARQEDILPTIKDY